MGCSLSLALFPERGLPRGGSPTSCRGPTQGARCGLGRCPGARRCVTYGDELSRFAPRVRNGVRNTRIWASMLGLTDTVIEDVELVEEPGDDAWFEAELRVVVHVRPRKAKT